MSRYTFLKAMRYISVAILRTSDPVAVVRLRAVAQQLQQAYMSQCIEDVLISQLPIEEAVLVAEQQMNDYVIMGELVTELKVQYLS